MDKRTGGLSASPLMTWAADSELFVGQEEETNEKDRNDEMDV